MCGIVGYKGNQNAISVLLSGLESLEYRGYDSAGIAYKDDKKINIIKSVGKIKNLKENIDDNIESKVGIAHTRWATHGAVTLLNAHPHKVGKITLVHNGIIENYEDLKVMLEENNYKFKGQTDTEIACGLIDYLYNNLLDMY